MGIAYFAEGVWLVKKQLWIKQDGETLKCLLPINPINSSQRLIIPRELCYISPQTIFSIPLGPENILSCWDNGLLSPVYPYSSNLSCILTSPVSTKVPLLSGVGMWGKKLRLMGRQHVPSLSLGQLTSSSYGFWCSFGISHGGWTHDPHSKCLFKLDERYLKSIKNERKNCFF